MKKNIFNTIFLILFLFQNSYTQTFISDSVKVIEKKYSKKQGYKIYGTKSILFDNDDWLWISGKTFNNAAYKLENRGHLIQRFNGYSFDDIPLPNTGLGDNVNIVLTKRNDGFIFVNFSKNQNSKLFLLNPKTLVFKEVPIPLNEQAEIHNIKLYVHNNEVLVSDIYENKAIIYQLSKELDFKLLTKLSRNTSFDINGVLKFDTYFLINDLNLGLLVYGLDGTLLKTISTAEINKESKNNSNPITVSYWFEKDSHYYMKFSQTDNLFKFNSKTISWSIASDSEYYTKGPSARYLESMVFQDSQKNTVIQHLTNDRLIISNYKNNILQPSFSFVANKTEFGIFTSRNLQKELVISNQGVLTFLSFSNPKINTFLEKYSIRGMLQTDNNAVLIATENQGWYSLSLKSLQLKEVLLTSDTKNYIPITNSGILKDKTGYWANNDKGILFIDKHTYKVTTYPLYRINTLTQDDSYIYYGASSEKKLMRFNKTTKQHQILFEKEGIIFQKIIKHNNTLFTATNLGLLVSENKKNTIYSLPPEDRYLLTVTYHKEYGILVGTRSGKVFQFNPIAKTYTLLYTDALKASIASLLIDDANKIWINTFGGIVSFNPSTKKTIRFSNRDGLSYFEANRYSALKTNDGHFLVGTLKGLNYFHPDSLTKTNINANLKLSSLTYYNEETASEQTILSPEELEKNNTIVLPVNNKNLNIHFGLTGVFNTEDIEFRYRFNKEPWISIANNSNLNLLSIPSGKHQLEIEALDFSKNKIGNSLLIPIFAKDHFYNQGWFYLLALLFILFVAYLYVSKRRKKEKNKMLEKENKGIKKNLANYTQQLIERNKEKKILAIEYEKLKSHYGEQEDLSKLQELATSKILTNDDWTRFKSKFEAAYPNYLIGLKNKGYKFTPTEERFITLEKLGLSSEETANMLGVSPETIRKTRYRLRKKLNAPNSITIIKFLENL